MSVALHSNVLPFDRRGLSSQSVIVCDLHSGVASYDRRPMRMGRSILIDRTACIRNRTVRNEGFPV